MKFNYLITIVTLLSVLDDAIKSLAAPVNIAEPSELVEQELDARAEYNAIFRP
jgi:hypothetical protein